MDEGKIFLKIQKSDDNVEISVEDTGLGIKNEDLKKLFKPFSRITKPGRYIGGSGLGLHLSKKLANLLGGEIFVESDFGKGSTFVFKTREKSKLAKKVNKFFLLI